MTRARVAYPRTLINNQSINSVRSTSSQQTEWISCYKQIVIQKRQRTMYCCIFSKSPLVVRSCSRSLLHSATRRLVATTTAKVGTQTTQTHLRVQTRSYLIILRDLIKAFIVLFQLRRKRRPVSLIALVTTRSSSKSPAITRRPLTSAAYGPPANEFLKP